MCTDLIALATNLGGDPVGCSLILRKKASPTIIKQIHRSTDSILDDSTSYMRQIPLLNF